MSFLSSQPGYYATGRRESLGVARRMIYLQVNVKKKMAQEPNPVNDTLSSFFTAFLQTHSSSSSRNSDLSVSLQIGHKITRASAPGGTTTNCAFNSASCLACSAFDRLGPTS